MSKKSNIRWRVSDTEKITKAINNYNAKLYRLAKNHPEMKEILPDRVKKSDVISSIETRADYNRFLESLQHFTKRGSEKPVTLENGITVTKFQQRELQQSVIDFNNKLKYHQRRYTGNAPYLPNEKSYDKILNTIENKDDIKNVTQALKDFLKPDSTSLVKSNRGAIFTKWEMNERLLEQQRDNELKKQERDKINEKPVKVGGVEQDVTRAEMGSVKENSLKDSNKNPMNMSQKEWDKFRDYLDSRLDKTEREDKKEQMRENYLKGLQESGFLDKNPDLEKIIRSVNIDDFIANVETDDTATFTFYKDPQAFDVRLEYITSTWETLYNEGVG